MIITEPSSETFQYLITDCNHKNQRRLLVLAGDRKWTVANAVQIGSLASDDSDVWVSDNELIIPTGHTVLPAKKYLTLLGQETQCLIIDCFDGFYPDAVAALSGCVRGGGLLVLLMPHWDSWVAMADEENKARAIHGVDVDAVSCRFRTRLKTLMASHMGCVVYQQSGMCESVFKVDLDCISPPIDCRQFQEQARVVETIKKVSTGHSRRPLVISSDRGRGKSSAFGLAAAELMLEGGKQIIITAPRSESVVAVFKHAKQRIDQWVSESGLQTNVVCEGLSIQVDNASLGFIPPDELLRADYKADLLLVDEAAAIPAPILTALVHRYSRIAFTTTIHGYEGTGRGFAIRFQNTLQQLRPHWRQCEMQQPIRWAEGDPLESFISDLFLLGGAEAQPIVTGRQSVQLNSADVEIVKIDRDHLIEDELTLSSIFSLLMTAHYRTTPSDLRDILDGPNIDLWVLRPVSREVERRVLGVMVVAREGGFDLEISQLVIDGKRRPRGHLLPQQLAVHLGYKNALELRSARVVRIATHFSIRNQGWGSELLDVFQCWAEEEGLDYIGSSFGGTELLVRYWGNNNYSPVRVGFTREASSGQHSLSVVKGLTVKGVSLVGELSQRFYCHFPHLLQSHLKQLEPEIVFQLLQLKPGCDKPNLLISEADMQDVAAFASSARPIESCSYGLWRASLIALSKNSKVEKLSEEDLSLLVTLFVQNYSVSAVTKILNLSGRKQLIKKARCVASLLLKSTLI